jgi:serine/threonine protein kinase
VHAGVGSQCIHSFGFFWGGSSCLHDLRTSTFTPEDCSSRLIMQNCLTMQIVTHISECLADLHQAGYVHRDLKPGNFMWLPSQNRWTLIDFGCATQIGQEAQAEFSLMYAAPEVVRAHFREMRQTVQATTAIDVWSVGVIAVELFSGRPPLRIFEGQEQVSTAHPCRIMLQHHAAVFCLFFVFCRIMLQYLAWACILRLVTL